MIENIGASVANRTVVILKNIINFKCKNNFIFEGTFYIALILIPQNIVAFSQSGAPT